MPSLLRSSTTLKLVTMSSSNTFASSGTGIGRSLTDVGEPAAKKPRTDGAKVGKKILNVGLQSSHASIVLDHIITKLKAGDPILKKDISFLETAKASIDLISPQLNSLVPQVAELPYLVRSFSTVTAEERAAMRTAQKIGKGAEAAFHSLKAFNKSVEEEALGQQQVVVSSSPSPSPRTPVQPVRASSRVSIPVLPPVVTPPPKSVDDIIGKNKIGAADVVFILALGKDFEERKRLVSMLLRTGKLELRGEKGKAVGKDLVWAVYCDATIPKQPLGEFCGQPVYTKEQIMEHLLPHRPPSGARSIEYKARIDALIRTGKTFTQSDRGIRDIVEGKSVR